MKIRTGYSFRSAVGFLPEVADRIKEIDWDHAPITDRNSTFGFAHWSKLCKERNLKPIYGVEIGVTEKLGQKNPPLDYWTFIAPDKLRYLHDLIAEATLNPGNEPSLLYTQARAPEGVIAIAGNRCRVDLMEKDDYIALTPSMPIGVYRAAKTKGLKFVASSDNVFTREGDREFYRVSMGKKASNQTYPQHIMSDKEWRASVAWFAADKDIKAAESMRRWLMCGCKAQPVKASILTPVKKYTLRQMCEQGAKKLGIDLTNEVYGERLKHELRMIKDKKYEDYFYVIADIINWSKQRMIVGPARGSSGGSLVCYLLGITAIDPIPHGLMFERFIDVTRDDLPDIDIDFSDVHRDRAFEYAEKTYGRDHVARLGSVNTWQAKSSLKQIGASLHIEPWKIDKLSAGIIQRMAGDARAAFTIQDTLLTTDVGREISAEYPEIVIAARLEDHPSVATQHAAGIVVTKRPVADHVAVDSRTGATMCNKYDAETFNLLKIDALGLIQLSVFERTLELIGEDPINGFLEKIPTDDPPAFEVLNKKHFAGIFQFVGGAVRGLCTQLLRNGKFSEFNDLVAINALARPGPMAGGNSAEWVARRTGRHETTYLHPSLEPHLKDTYGIIVFQEQVLAICRDLGGMSWEEVTTLRRAMSRSMGAEYFDKFGETFKSGAKDIPDKIADKIWHDLITFGGYGFNKSHSVAYALISYWCCWLKAHHPLEFAAATLDVQKETSEQILLLRELQEEGIKYVPVDPERSVARWVPVRGTPDTLIGPLTSIHGIGPATVRDVLESRKTGAQLKPSVEAKLTNPTTAIDTLYPVRDVVEKLSNGNLEEAFNIVSKPTAIIDIDKEMDNEEVMIIGVVTKLTTINENDPKRVERRGHKVNGGQEDALNVFVRDDTDKIFCKVNRYDFPTLGKQMLEKGGVGKSIYALKGNLFIRDDFRMLTIKQFRFIGDLPQ